MKQVVYAVLLIVALSAGYLAVNSLLKKDSDSATSTNTMKSYTTDSGLMIEILSEGNGEAVKEGDEISVHYKGTLEDGTQFDSSYDRGVPLSFTVGDGMVIKGWEEGVVGMKIGEKRRLTIPASLGYGAGGYPPIIPPNAVLIFEIELIAIK